MVLNIGAKCEGKMTCATKVTYRLLCIFLKIISQFCISQW